MKGAVLHAPGGLDRLVVTDLPDPGTPGPGEVRVRIRASTVNFHDRGIVTGVLHAPDRHVPMADGAGVVEAVGADVHDLAVGDHVVAVFFPQWQAGPPVIDSLGSAAGIGRDGYAREVVVAPAGTFTRAPGHLSHTEAAAITVAGVTAATALEGLAPGEVVVVLGTGGVSTFALQLAKAAGAAVVVTSSSWQKLQRALDLGADHVINYRDTPHWGQRVLELTGGRGAERVVEVGGPGTLPQSITAVAVGGRISLVGVLTGVEGLVPTDALMMKQARLQGIVVGSRSTQQKLVRFLETQRIHPVIDRAFPLARIAEAFSYQGTGAHLGKVALEL
ncbi:zinc-binding dehydrogenase [Kineococcus aurantiacus]|uniref:zinc-binding dehydrogenase n=1 Tax=Kineococcus aurantiacus TaxID=37633 RepID=UPI0015C730EA